MGQHTRTETRYSFSLQMSEYSLSVDDEALHPVLISHDTGWPDIIAERSERGDVNHTLIRTKRPHFESSMMTLGSGRHFVLKFPLRNLFCIWSSKVVKKTMKNFALKTVQKDNKMEACAGISLFLPYECLLSKVVSLLQCVDNLWHLVGFGGLGHLHLYIIGVNWIYKVLFISSCRCLQFTAVAFTGAFNFHLKYFYMHCKKIKILRN